MTKFLATVLSVIAAGLMLIAYGVLSPRVTAADAAPQSRPMIASQRSGDIEDLTLRRPLAYAVNDAGTLPSYDDLRRENAALRMARADDLVRARTESSRARSSTQRSTAPARVVRASGRDWTKTAMVIGGTSAAGAGLGAIFGGKKGALIGAAIGGGAGTLFEVKGR